MICKECLTKLDVAYQIKKLSLETENSLKMMVTKEMKRKLEKEQNNEAGSSKKLTFGEKLEQIKLKTQMEMENYQIEAPKEIEIEPEIKMETIEIEDTGTEVKEEESTKKAPKIPKRPNLANWPYDHVCSPNEVCFLCNKTFTNKSQIIEHLEEDHRSTTNGRFQCPSKGCLTTYLYADSFFYHIITHFECCGKEKLIQRWK